MIGKQSLLAGTFILSALVGSSLYVFLPLIYAAVLQWIFFYSGLIALVVADKLESQEDWISFISWVITLVLLGIGFGLHGLVVLFFAKIIHRNAR